MKARRRKKKASFPGPAVGALTGVAWFDREQWELLRSVAADPERLQETYEQWLAVGERALRDLRAATDLSIEAVPIRTKDLIAWCAEQGRPVDSAARAEFAARLLQKRYAAAPPGSSKDPGESRSP